MKLWQSLFAIIWITFVEFLLVMATHVPPFDSMATILTYLHAALGFGIIAIAFQNYSGVRATTIAGRVKRTVRATFQLSILMAVLGVVLLFPGYLQWTVPLVGVTLFYAILFVHVVNAFAIITQTAAAAIAYDMWEDKELEQVTRPGEVPPPPPMPGWPPAKSKP